MKEPKEDEEEVFAEDYDESDKSGSSVITSYFKN